MSGAPASPNPLAMEQKGAFLPAQTHGAFELKFALRDEVVAPVLAWARAHVPADPFGETYDVNSLYFDRDDLAVFHRADGFDERKYRVRRYGNERLLYLEEKEKLGGWVRKRRTPIADVDLFRLDGFDLVWPGAWFARLMREHGLAPRSQVAYRRVARVGEAEGGPIRMTVDQGVRCALATGLDLPPLCPDEATPIARNILELKFGRSGLPALYKRLIAEFGLEPEASSKYRLSILATEGRLTMEGAERTAA